jgi:hypothetical protein
MNEEQIQGYLAFEEDDLIANRAGRLSEKQSRRVKDADRFADRLLLAISLLFLAAAVFVGVLAIFAAKNVGLWIGTVILLLIAIWLFRGARTEVDDAVQKAQGEVNFIKIEKQTGSVNDPAAQRTRVTGYEMRVGDETFGNVNPALVECMQGRTYTVYFTKTTRQILSVEQVSNGNEIPSSETASAHEN